ncbi:uncharacterized protein N7473_006378 [Penicillium subrubescens]|uniref:DDE-1 domain-containing protein n=1 Tax=Penicillium subrubescens TaxID=1316194 RepID=A0A1Q5UE82_9EURO|nr:uncharacterized protein N7473_006378 [Penicillium subrubescens]KAJ5896979.1 hypothetical protein N7473_006378 [Penicillium subrubescens]OKP10780.1 hypothetical protein PENSUB_3600 [Penicillium subrubescens]
MARFKDKRAPGSKSQFHRNLSPEVQPPSPEGPGSATRPRINRILSDEDEAEVAQWLNRWLDHGFPLENQKQVSAFVRYFMHITNHPNKDVGVGDEFYESLFKRNGTVKDRVYAARQACKSAKLKNEDKKAKEERLSRFPAFLRHRQQVLEVQFKHIYVFGDTGFVTAISSEHQGLCIEASTRDDGDHRRITSAVICASYDNRFLSPYLISKTGTVNRNRMVYKTVSTSFAVKPWANTEFFLDWIDFVFEEETKPPRFRGHDAPARLLLVDGVRYGITPEIFMSCWKKDIYLLCIPHKGSTFFNPLECGVFSKMHKVYADDVVTRYREEKKAFVQTPEDMTSFILRLLDRDLLKGRLGKAWVKSHLYSEDEVALRKYVKGIPATPAPVSPAKTRTRSVAQHQVVQDQPMSPPRSSRQAEETRHTRGSTTDSGSTSDETPERQRPSKSSNRPSSMNGPRREPRNAPSSQSLASPSRAHGYTRNSEIPEQQSVETSDEDMSEEDDSDYEDFGNTASENEFPHDEDSVQAASPRNNVTSTSRESPLSHQRPSPVTSCYMSGEVAQNDARPVALSVEINSRASLQPNVDAYRPRDNQSADTDRLTDNTDNTWTGEGLQKAYKMQIRALSDPKTPQSQRRAYEQKLLALAPILTGFAPGTITALQALTKTCSTKSQSHSASPRPLTPQTNKKARVRKRKSDNQSGHLRTDRGPRQMNSRNQF